MAKLIVNELLPVTAALVDSVTPARPVSLTWVYGDDNPLDLYLADGEGGYHADSGTTGVTAKLAIVTPGAVPTGGTGLLSYNSNDSSAINYNTTAAQLQTAINAISGIPQTVVVTGSDGGFTVEADTVGTWTYDLVNGDVTTFTPDGIFQIKEVTAGDGSTKQKYLIEIRRPEHSATTSWTQITNGWSGNFPVANEAVWGLFGGETEIDATLELQITDASGKVRTPLQQKIKLRIDGIISGSPNTSEGDAFYTKTESDNLFLKKANNLSDITDAATARTNLGITSLGGDETEISLVTPSATGSANFDPDDERAHSVLHITPGTGAGSYTFDYTIVHPGGSGEPAPLIAVYCAMPASNNPTIRIYETGANLLATFSGTVRGARKHVLLLVWDGTAYVPVTEDTHFKALGYHPVWIPAAAMIPRSTNGASEATQETSTNKTMLETLSFPGEVTGTPTDTHAQFSFGSPGGWDETDVLVQFEWFPFESGSTLDAVWAAQAKCIGDNGDPDAAWGTAVQVSDTVQTVGYKHVSAWVNAITPASASAGDAIFWQFTREASDVADTIHDGASNAVACDLYGVRLLFQMDQLNDDESSKSNP